MRFGILRRVMGTRLGLRLLFGGLARRFDPERAKGFAGELQCDLRTKNGAVRSWTIEVHGDHAHARPGAAADPKLTVTAGLDDFLRIVTRELDPTKALLTGRLDVAGDFRLLMRLGAMFGAPSSG